MCYNVVFEVYSGRFVSWGVMEWIVFYWIVFEGVDEDYLIYVWYGVFSSLMMKFCVYLLL